MWRCCDAARTESHDDLILWTSAVGCGAPCERVTAMKAEAGSRDRMARDVEQKLFKFYDLGADATPRLPPPIRVKP